MSQPALTPESFKSLFANSPTGMLVEGVDGIIRDVNASACELFGAQRDQIIGSKSADLIPENTIPAPFNDATPRMGTLRAKDNSTLRVAMQVTPIESELEPGSLISIWSINQDPSQVDSEVTLPDHSTGSHHHHSMQQASRHIANVISDSLTPIQGFVSLAQADLKQGRISGNHLEQIASAADRGADFARELFSFSRMAPHEEKVLAPGKFLPSIQPELDELAGDGVKLTLLIPEDTPPIMVSHHDLRTIMHHAVGSAAAKASVHDNRHINISCSTVSVPTSADTPATSLTTAISITDNGPSLTREIATRVFDPFYSLPQRDDPHGLRLPTIQQLMRNHGGRAQFLSSGDKGNTLKLLFSQSPRGAQPPVLAEEQAHLGQSPSINEENGHSSPGDKTSRTDKTILVVEDENTVRETVVHNLQYLGYRVLEAGNGEQGLAISREHRDEIDLIFSDVVMPRMSGPAMITLMKKEKLNLPVLYTTGYADAPGINKEDPIITKPYTTKALAARIREILEPANA